MDNPSNQMHGKSYENLIKSANGIVSYSATDRKRTHGDRFDIGADDDNDRGIPTSIKATGGNGITLSDARKFWQSFNYAPYRILVGKYSKKKT